MSHIDKYECKPTLTKNDVCQIGNFSLGKLNTLIKARQIPFVKIGRLVRFRPEDINSFLSGNLQEVKNENK